MCLSTKGGNIKNIIKIGCRESNLSMVQSNIVKSILEKNGYKCIINPISTTGDQNIEKPIYSIGEIGVFTKEIDKALIDNEIDISVHSLKDIGLERPPGIETAAILNREMPNDISIFNENIIEKLKNNEKIVIGTSSPRRTLLIKRYLSDLLPYFGKQHIIDVQNIRGNVLSRISRVENHEYDGIILALAGINRLGPEILKNKKYMVLPISIFPGAPGQGCIAVDVLSKNRELLNLIKNINQEDSYEIANIERYILKQFGGGCHQKFGASVLRPAMNYKLIYCIGDDLNGNNISYSQAHHSYKQSNNHINSKSIVINGDDVYNRYPLTTKEIIQQIDEKINNKNEYFFFISRYFNNNISNVINNYCKKVWVSGVKTWKKTAKLGIWVEGCAEGLGIEYISREFCKNKKAILLPEVCINFTHQSTQASTVIDDNVKPIKISNIITYNIFDKDLSDISYKINYCDNIYWTSFYAFDKLFKYTKKNATHSCGFGKTYTLISQKYNININRFHSIDAWKDWAKVKYNE